MKRVLVVLAGVGFAACVVAVHLWPTQFFIAVAVVIAGIVFWGWDKTTIGHVEAWAQTGRRPTPRQWLRARWLGTPVIVGAMHDLRALDPDVAEPVPWLRRFGAALHEEGLIVDQPTAAMYAEVLTQVGPLPSTFDELKVWVTAVERGMAGRQRPITTEDVQSIWAAVKRVGPAEVAA